MSSHSSVYEGPEGPLRHRCASCDAIRPDLLRCTGCRLVRYCSRDHQVQHRPQHKSLCKKTSKLREKLQREDHAVQNATQDFMTPANAFETHVGHFWGLLNTRDYMRARFAVADEARLACTLDGVTEALEHFQDMLRLCRGDNMGVRDHMPALMLRLDLDQECYDFIKWWEIAGQDGDYDWGDTELPFLNVKNANIMESPKFLVHRFGNLGYLASVLLLKIKMLIDIRNIKVARKVLAGRLPIELWREVERNAIRSPLSLRFVDRPYRELSETEHELVAHCCDIGGAIDAINGDFLFELVNLSEKTLSYRPEAYSHGSYEYMVLAMHQAYASWWETEGALGLLQNACLCAWKDNWDYYLVHRHSPTGSQDMESIGFGKVFDVLELVVKDNSYLGPPDDRPSQHYTREE